MLPPFLPFWTNAPKIIFMRVRQNCINHDDWMKKYIILISGGSISSLLHGCFVHNPSLYAVLHWCMGRYFWPKETHVHLPNSKLTWKCHFGSQRCVHLVAQGVHDLEPDTNSISGRFSSLDPKSVQFHRWHIRAWSESFQDGNDLCCTVIRIPSSSFSRGYNIWCWQ